MNTVILSATATALTPIPHYIEPTYANIYVYLMNKKILRVIF